MLVLGMLAGEEEPQDLLQELADRVDPKRAERMKRHLELVWKIAKVRWGRHVARVIARRSTTPAGGRY
jgi:hypothetical protein